MTITERIYRFLHRKDITNDTEIPYFWKYSILTIISKPIRKFFSAIVIPTIPFAGFRIWAYRRCGYKIGHNTFIGLRCYLDDMCYDKIKIGNNVTISYGVYFACHGRKQGHNEIIIEDGAYIGMKASIVARNPITISENAIVGACSLVNKSIPSNSVAVGIPIRIINKHCDESISYSKLTTSRQEEHICVRGGGKQLYITVLSSCLKFFVSHMLNSAKQWY